MLPWRVFLGTIACETEQDSAKWGRAALSMFRKMGMQFGLDKAESTLKELSTQ